MIRITILTVLVSSLLIDAARKWGADSAMAGYEEEMKAQNEWSADLERDQRRTVIKRSSDGLRILQWHWPLDTAELRITDPGPDRPRLPVLSESTGRHAMALLITCGEWILQK